jgi:hypothetical protein
MIARFSIGFSAHGERFEICLLQKAFSKPQHGIVEHEEAKSLSKLVSIHDEQTFVGHKAQIEQIGEDTEHSHLLSRVYDGLFNICSNCENPIRCVNDCQNKGCIYFCEKMILCTNLVCPNAWYHAKCVKYNGVKNWFCSDICEHTPKENHSKIFNNTLAGNKNRKMRLEVGQYGCTYYRCPSPISSCPNNQLIHDCQPTEGKVRRYDRCLRRI